MRIQWAQRSRRLPWPRWSILLLTLCLMLGGVCLLLGAVAGRQMPLCLFKHVTGCPCPTCGFTRGTLSLLQGHPVQGWLYNPLLFSLLGVLAVAVGVRLLFARGIEIHLANGERKAAWTIVLILFALNWLYVIFCVG